MSDPDSQISSNRRYNLLCIPWVVTLIVTWPGVFYPLLLPAGLYRLFGLPETKALDRGPLLLCGWLVYVGLTVAACLSKQRRHYFIVYFVLCVLLALNSVGCRAFWSELSHVQ